MDENIVYTSLYTEVNLSIFHHKEEKEMEKLFHIKIEIKKTNVDALFDCNSCDNLIVEYRVSKLV